MSIAGVFFGADAVRNALTGQFRSLLGPTGSQVVEVMLKGAGSTSAGTLAGILGIALLLVEAVGVVVQLKDALNTIWETKEPEGAGMWWYLRTYLVSFAGILALGFLLAVSLVVSTGLAALSSWLGGGGSLWQVVNFLVSLAVLVFFCSPCCSSGSPTPWLAGERPSSADLSLPFCSTSASSPIGWYIGTQGLESTYGAAASLVVLLIWVYYSAQIVLFGAEITHVLTTAQVRESH